uniref:Uncharacterized protein n=1 Tax=Glossina pallidipes TaxID=7398 RepID=A0A1A9ZEJ8_GLOPL
MLGKISIIHFHVSFSEYCIRIIREIVFKVHLRRYSGAYDNVHLDEMMDHVISFVLREIVSRPNAVNYGFIPIVTLYSYVVSLSEALVLFFIQAYIAVTDQVDSNSAPAA